MNAESKLEQAAKEYATNGSYQEWLKLPQNKSLGFTEGVFAKTMRNFIAGAKSEAAKEYWQSLTTPAGNVKSFLDVLTENYQAQIAGFYNDDKTDAERAKRNAVIEEYQDLIAIFKSGYTTPSKPHTEEGQLIPMSEITDEARSIAVSWVENYEPMGFDIQQKHKLASDIMNYAASQCAAKDAQISDLEKRLKEVSAIAVDLGGGK